MAPLGCLLSWGCEAASSTTAICLIDLDGVSVLDSVVVAPPIMGVACLGLAPGSADGAPANGHDTTAPPHALEVLVVHGEPRILSTLRLSGVKPPPRDTPPPPPPATTPATPLAGAAAADEASPPAFDVRKACSKQLHFIGYVQHALSNIDVL